MIGFELKILDALQKLHFPALDFIMIFLSNLGEWGIFFVFLTVLLLISKKTRRVGFVCATSLLLSLLVVNVALKPLVERVRPFVVNTAAQLISAPPLDFSFPSGHSSASFAFAASIKPLGKRWSAAAYVLAALIAFSRLYLYVHFPSDVLAGVLIGIGIGIFSRHLWRRKLNYR